MDSSVLRIEDYFEDYSCDVVENRGLLVAMCTSTEKKVSALLREKVWSTEAYCQFWSLSDRKRLLSCEKKPFSIHCNTLNLYVPYRKTCEKLLFSTNLVQKENKLLEVLRIGLPELINFNHHPAECDYTSTVKKLGIVSGLLVPIYDPKEGVIGVIEILSSVEDQQRAFEDLKLFLIKSDLIIFGAQSVEPKAKGKELTENDSLEEEEGLKKSDLIIYGAPTVDPKAKGKELLPENDSLKEEEGKETELKKLKPKDILTTEFLREHADKQKKSIVQIARENNLVASAVRYHYQEYFKKSQSASAPTGGESKIMKKTASAPPGEYQAVKGALSTSQSGKNQGASSTSSGKDSIPIGKTVSAPTGGESKKPKNDVVIITCCESTKNDDETKKVKFTIEKGLCTVDTISSRMAALLGAKPEPCNLVYLDDDNEWITLEDPSQLSYALQEMKNRLKVAFQKSV